MQVVPIAYYHLRQNWDEIGKACGSQEKAADVYRIWVANPKVKRSLGRSRHGWEGNMRMDPEEIEWKVLELSVTKVGTCTGFF